MLEVHDGMQFGQDFTPEELGLVDRDKDALLACARQFFNDRLTFA
jgi:hypothetical protein